MSSKKSSSLAKPHQHLTRIDTTTWTVFSSSIQRVCRKWPAHVSQKVPTRTCRLCSSKPRTCTPTMARRCTPRLRHKLCRIQSDSSALVGLDAHSARPTRGHLPQIGVRSALKIQEQRKRRDLGVVAVHVEALILQTHARDAEVRLHADAPSKVRSGAAARGGVNTLRRIKVVLGVATVDLPARNSRFPIEVHHWQ